MPEFRGSLDRFRLVHLRGSLARLRRALEWGKLARLRGRLRPPFGLSRSTWRAVAAVALAVALATAAWAAWYVRGILASLPDRAAIQKAGQMADATTLYDAADHPVFTIYKKQRMEVPLDRISPNLLHAIVAIEDQRFYEHGAVDYRRVVAAALADLRLGRPAQGGSTITQQLARQSFLTADKTLRRKLSEVFLAMRLERIYSKNEILRLYLNKVYFGDGFYGAEAASLGYFDKHASDLSLPEAALLAGIVKSPSVYSPTVNLPRAIGRRNLVLQAMRETGAISAAAFAAARSAPVRLENGLDEAEAGGQYFKEQVRRELVDRFGWQRVYEGGLRVFTTLDSGMQQAAEQAVSASLAAIEARRAAVVRAGGGRGRTAGEAQAAPGQEPLQAALVAIDPATGAVRATIGGRDFQDSSFNRAVQARRQPGSAFKPFVYTEAIEAGYTPATFIDHLNDPIPTLQGDWTPEDEHSTTDSMTLRTALRTSSNRAAVRLLQDVGVARTVEYARRVGLGTLPGVPSLALGSGEVTLLSLAAAYVPFADRGVARPPVFIRRVENREGHLLYATPDRAAQVISPGTAFLMSQMLAGVVDAGTAYKARLAGFTLPAAGKTGTTNDFKDAWFIGYTPTLLAGVWIGFDNPKTILPNGFAGDLAVPLWAAFMKVATRDDKPAWFPQPPDVVAVPICRMSGKLPAPGCDHVRVVADDGTVEEKSMVYTEFFERGTEPHDTCPLHRSWSLLDRLAGLFSARPVPQPASGGQIEASTGGPSAGTVGPDAQPRAAQAAPEARQVKAPKKKRGFWARLFGIGKDEDKDNDKKDRK
jgi:1A family penicillin-binding protein